MTEARQVLEQAWGPILNGLAMDVDVRSTATLRLVAEIQEWTAEVALREPETSDGLLSAAERQSSLVAGLLAWGQKREDAYALLRERSGLAELIPHGALLVTAARARQTTVFIAASRRRTIQLLALGNAELERVRAECRAAARRSSPRGKPLELSRAWRNLNEQLSQALQPLLGGVSSVLFTGAATTGLPLHLTTIGGVELVRMLPCSSASSLLQLAGLQGRRAPGAAQTIRAGIATTGSSLDSEDAQAAFADGANRVRAVLGKHAGELTVLRGAEATPGAVLEMLKQVDLVALSCHGLADPGYGSHALLLAADGQLPPKLIAPGSEHGRRFLLEWDAIAGPTPPVVVSAACSSSSATSVEGGERIALDRAFLAAGTRVFAGPLWDVAIDDSHALVSQLIERAVPTGDWAGAWHEVARENSADLPQASWGAYVLVGDGRATS